MIHWTVFMVNIKEIFHLLTFISPLSFLLFLMLFLLLKCAQFVPLNIFVYEPDFVNMLDKLKMFDRRFIQHGSGTTRPLLKIGILMNDHKSTINIHHFSFIKQGTQNCNCRKWRNARDWLLASHPIMNMFKSQKAKYLF